MFFSIEFGLQLKKEFLCVKESNSNGEGQGHCQTIVYSSVFVFVYINLYGFHDHTISNWIFSFRNHRLHAMVSMEMPRTLSKPYDLFVCTCACGIDERVQDTIRTHTVKYAYLHILRNHLEYQDFVPQFIHASNFIHDQVIVKSHSVFFWARTHLDVRVEQFYWAEPFSNRLLTSVSVSCK